MLLKAGLGSACLVLGQGLGEHPCAQGMGREPWGTSPLSHAPRLAAARGVRCERARLRPGKISSWFATGKLAPNPWPSEWSLCLCKPILPPFALLLWRALCGFAMKPRGAAGECSPCLSSIPYRVSGGLGWALPGLLGARVSLR